MLLGEYLIQNNLLSREQLRIGLNEQAVTGEKLGEILIRFGFIARGDLNSALLTLRPEALVGSVTSEASLPREFLLKTQTLIQSDIGQEICLSTLHDDHAWVRSEAKKLTGRDVRLVPASHVEILNYVKELEREEKSGNAVMNDEEDVNILISAIINEALKDNATDIHIEPSERSIHVRYRIDKMIHDARVLSLQRAGRLFSRIKDMSVGMDVSERLKPQDGSFSREYRGRMIDFRVSTMPCDLGEKITIRILDKEKNLRDIHSLGISCINPWLELAEMNTGLVLVCGATGSGKTTTLYSTLMYRDRLGQTTYTMEDPVEYRLPFVTQIQVNRRAGQDFASITRAVLRHDPDTIVLGEIRDRETVENALHLSDTGHLVYGSLHSNDVPTSLIRLEALGAKEQSHSSIRMQLRFQLRGILVQTLARKLCLSCLGSGCEHCKGVGYKGLTLLSEFARLRRPEDFDAILAGKFRYHTFLDDAVYKIRDGVTDAREVLRVTDISSDDLSHALATYPEEVPTCMS